MTAYALQFSQGTVRKLPASNYSFQLKLRDETNGGIRNDRYIPEENLIETALSKVRQLADRKMAEEIKRLLLIFQESISLLQQHNVEISRLPPLLVFPDEDGSVLIEWIFPEFRIGFVFDPIPEDSSWYLVSAQQLGGIGLSGYISNLDLGRLVGSLVSYALLNS